MKILFFLLFLLFLFILKISKEQCTNFDNNYICENDQHEFPESWDDNCFQTPPRNDIFGNYKNSYQDMHYLVGYARLKYSEDYQICDITFITKVNPILGAENVDYKIIYKFGDSEQNSNTFRVTSGNSYSNGMPISAEIVDMNNNHLVELILENEYFIWDHPQINLRDNYENGQKGVIVELLGWPYEDIAEECEFLGYAGYLGVKIYSPNEHILTYKSTNNGELNHLDFIFYPVSYKLESRMGDKHQLNNMINKCRQHGVRVYSELVINHMTSNGDDSYQKHINPDCSNYGPTEGSAGSPFWTVKGLNKNNPYTGASPVVEYPSVPYCNSDFHCYSYVEYGDDDNIKTNYGWIYNLVDLNTGKEYVRQRIADFFTELISIGISGFTLNSVVNVSPTDYAYILKKLKYNLGNHLTEDFLMYLQVDIWGTKKYLYICDNNEYNFGEFFVLKMQEAGLSDDEINKIKIWNSGYFDNIRPECNGEWKISKERYVLGWTNHYILTPGSDDIYMKNKNLIEHKAKYIELLSDNIFNWKIKFIFSAYTTMNNGAFGFPDGKSDCSKCINEQCSIDCTKSVPYQKAYNPLSTGYDSGDESNWKEGTYTRIHRNVEIVNAMRTWMGLNNFDNENSLFQSERLKVNCPEECLICNEESKELGKCIQCNEDNGYYPIFIDKYERYHKCFKNQQEEYFFDEQKKYYVPCYETCKTCEKEGNEINHNCLTCKDNYILGKNEKNKNNCIEIYKMNVTVPFYIIIDSNDNNKNKSSTDIFRESTTEIERVEMDAEKITEIFKIPTTEMKLIETEKVTEKEQKIKPVPYKVIELSQCLKEGKLFIKDKNICIDDCKDDDTFKYKYNGECLMSCSNATYNDSYICKEKSNKCELTENEIELENFSENGGISSIAKTYSEEYSYTNNHVTKFRNNEYEIYFYKNSDCIEELSLEIPKVDFGNCYNKAKDYYSINDSLVIVTLYKYLHNDHLTTHSFYDSLTAQKLVVEKLCENETIVQKENVLNILKEKNLNTDNLLFFINQNIDIFNTSNEFYTDICYDFKSLTNKDITLKDRLLSIFPNITLCEKNCENKGVNITTMTSICECKFKDIINNDFLKDNALISSATNEVTELLSQSNLEVLKCYKYIFKYFSKLFGGYIVIFFTLIHIILFIVFFKYELIKTKKYIFDLTNQYINHLSKIGNNKNKICDKINPPRKKSLEYKLKKNSNKKSNKYHLKYNNGKFLKKEQIKNNDLKNNHFTTEKHDSNNNNILLTYNNINSKINNIKSSNDMKIGSVSSLKLKFKNIKKKEFKDKNLVNFKEYLEPSLDDLEFEDALKMDNRKLCNHFCDNVKEKQIIANTFLVKDNLRPKSIKIMLFDLNIILYFVINGLFFSEDYISEIYHLKEKETFFSYFPRSIQRLIYTTIVSLVINVIVECFMINESKIKGIFIREKENQVILKHEIILLMKKLSKSVFLFFIISLVFYLLFFYYLLCFNYVYPNMQIEWIKSSITIVIIMQFLSILSCFIQTILRFMSFKCKIEKMYKISRLLD